MAFDYLFWGFKKVPHCAQLKALENDKNRFRIAKGVSRAQDFPADACYRMDPEFPDETLTPDQLPSESAQILVSERVKTFLEGRGIPGVEYLPVTVYDHRERKVQTQYFIVHPVGIADVLDETACTPTFDITGKAFERVESFVLKPDLPSELPALIRIKGLNHYIAVQRELATAMQAAGFSGAAFLEPKALVGKDLAPKLWER